MAVSNLGTGGERIADSKNCAFWDGLDLPAVHANTMLTGRERRFRIVRIAADPWFQYPSQILVILVGCLCTQQCPILGNVIFNRPERDSVDRPEANFHDEQGDCQSDGRQRKIAEQTQDPAVSARVKRQQCDTGQCKQENDQGIPGEIAARPPNPAIGEKILRFAQTERPGEDGGNRGHRRNSRNKSQQQEQAAQDRVRGNAEIGGRDVLILLRHLVLCPSSEADGSSLGSKMLGGGDKPG